MKNFEKMKKIEGKKSRFRSISIAMNVYNFTLQSCMLISIEIRFHHEYAIFMQNLNSQLIFVIFFFSFFSFYGFFWYFIQIIMMAFMHVILTYIKLHFTWKYIYSSYFLLCSSFYIIYRYLYFNKIELHLNVGYVHQVLAFDFIFLKFIFLKLIF